MQDNPNSLRHLISNPIWVCIEKDEFYSYSILKLRRPTFSCFAPTTFKARIPELLVATELVGVDIRPATTRRKLAQGNVRLCWY